MPQRNRLLRAFDPESILKAAAKSLGFNLEDARNVKRISSGEKDKRDLLVYWLWQTGRLSTNDAIGAYFDLTYSAISRCAKVIRDRIAVDREMRGQYIKIKSQIKV